MTPVPYVPEQHFEPIKAWLRHWNEDMTPDMLPQTGFIVPGKAAAFLYRTDSSLVWIENVIAAPGLPKEERSQAVDAVIAACCVEAARLGFKLALGYTVLDAMVKRVERLGFFQVASGFHLVAMKL
jgi:hypothetical protein